MDVVLHLSGQLVACSLQLAASCQLRETDSLQEEAMLESRAACATVVSGCVDAAGDEQEHSATSSPWLCEMHTQVGKQAHALHAHILQCSNENLLIHSPQPAALQ